MNKYSVVFSGSQGSGKTTLANAWAKSYGVEYKAVETRKFTPEGCSSHMDILRLAVTDSDAAINFQSTLIKERFKLFQKLEEEQIPFTSDRAVIDSYIYYLMHNSVFANKQNNLTNLALTNASVGTYDLTVLLNPKIGEPKDDDFRVSNPFYYLAYADLHKSTTLRNYDSIFANAKNIMTYEFEDFFEVDGVSLIGSIKVHVARTPSDKKRGFAILSEPNGMIPTEGRISLIQKALDAFSKM